MSFYLENFGLGFLEEDEENMAGFVAMSAEEGKPIVGYYGLPYFNQHFGELQVVLATDHNPEKEDGLIIDKLYTHAAGRAVWTVRLSEIDVDHKDGKKLAKRVMVKRADMSGGMAVVDLVNADVLPSFMENDLVKMQVIGFPEIIEYYEDEDAYAEAQPEMENGRKYLLAPGAVIANGFLNNHAPNKAEAEQKDHLDNIANVCGEVTALYWRKMKIGDTEDPQGFVCCLIDTEYGELEIVHQPDQVSDEMRRNMKVGAFVNFYGSISADVAIYEYDKGIVRDEEHDLAALRFAIQGDCAERLRSILKEESVYFAGYKKITYHGPDEIIKRLDYVRHENEDNLYTHLATISSVDEGDEPLPYGVGKRCVIIAEDEPTNYRTIAFLDVDENGYIDRLETSTNSRYHFMVDMPPVPEFDFSDIEIPESVTTPILNRAKYHGMLDWEGTEEEVMGNTYMIPMFENNIERVIESLIDGGDYDEETLFPSIFGYLFAKAIELTYAEDDSTEPMDVGYSPEDIRNGEIHTNLGEEALQKLQKAMKLGEQFYKDYCFFAEEGEEGKPIEKFKLALMTVQQIGRVYSSKCLGAMQKEESHR